MINGIAAKNCISQIKRSYYVAATATAFHEVWTMSNTEFGVSIADDLIEELDELTEQCVDLQASPSYGLL